MSWHFTVVHPISGYAFLGRSIVTVYHSDYEKAVEKLYHHLCKHSSTSSYIKDVDLEGFKDYMMDESENNSIITRSGLEIYSVHQEDVAIL